MSASTMKNQIAMPVQGCGWRIHTVFCTEHRFFLFLVIDAFKPDGLYVQRMGSVNLGPVLEFTQFHAV